MITVGVAIEADKLARKREAAVMQQHLLQVQSSIERTLNQRLSILVALAALVESHAQQNRLDSQRDSQRDLELGFQALAAAIGRQVDSVLDMRLAPAGIVTYVSNPTDSRQVIGFDILTNPQRKDVAISTIQQRTLNLAGPAWLMPGWEAVIARLPIFIPGAFDPQVYIENGRVQPDDPLLQQIPPDFWGFAVVLIDTDMLYREAGLDHLPSGYHYALRGRDGTGAQGEIFWGDKTVFDQPSYTIDIVFPNGKWVLGVRSVKGANWTSTLVILGLGSLLSGALSYAAYLNRRSKDIAEANSQAKGDFLAVMSHELRTPLNGIIGLTDLALHSRQEADRFYYLEKIQASSQLLLRLVNDVLDFSKLEAGKFTIISTPFLLDDVFASLRDLLALQAAKKDLELIFHISPDVPNQLIGDSLRLGQILINLVANAIKFTDSGSITLIVDRLPTSTDRARLRFDVCDTGIGLTSAQISTLFQAFTQVHDFATRPYGGTGLGLTICRRLLDLMGGTITINSESGRGSRFRVCLDFDLPATTATTAMTTPTEPNNALNQLHLDNLETTLTSQKDKRCLVVDANPNTGQAIATMLEGFGLQVAVTDSGAAAIDSLLAAENEPFNLLLIDDAMPEMSGYETVLRLDADFLIAPLTRVLLLPSSGSISREAEKRYNGIDYQLQKPIDRRQLRNLLEAISTEHSLPTSLRRSSHPASFHPASPITSPNTPIPPVPRTSHPTHFPTPSTTATPRNRTTPPKPKASYATILLIEDNEVNQIVAREMLQVLGYDVEIASDGYTAIDQVRSRRYDLLLMDVQMPQMDGFEATRRIRQLASSSEPYRWCETVPIVAMTAHSLDDYERICLDAGMNAQITKPITLDLLASTLQRWLPHVPSSQLSPAGILPYELVHLDHFDAPSGTSRSSIFCSLETAESTRDFADLPDLPECPGLSIEIGLQRMGDDWEGYGELLQLFATTYRSFDQDFEHWMDQGDYSQAKDRLHTLKGAAGNIGAEDLMQAASELEQELNAESRHLDRLKTLLLNTIREFHQVLDSIDVMTDYIKDQQP
ncbi:MAG: response regulator [Coleofasciculaceae cyanobacterium RL_1_1]|nr:response regulator [Coleofasciculaceae cyanobacterium RL_1_1]